MRFVAAILVLYFCWSSMEVVAQPVRNGEDIIWARDVEGEEMTVDGVLDEEAWDQAEQIVLQWNNVLARPGSGQRVELDPVLAEPLDGNDGTLRVLRDDNLLFMSLEVNDKSIGGGRGLQAGNFAFDGFLASFIDRSRRPEDYSEFGSINTQFGPFQVAEIIYGWWHPADTTDTGEPVPGIMPRAFGEGIYAQGFGDPVAPPPNPMLFDYATTVDGVANDDTNGTGSPTDDTGYVMEWSFNLDSLGYDMSSAEGDALPFNLGLIDADYRWPFDEDQQFVSRVWWQNQWANNFNEGIAYIYGRSDVTTSSGAAPEVREAEFVVPNVGDETLTVDGQLDEAAWTEMDPQFQLQYQPSIELLDQLPGVVAPYYVNFFRPDINGDDPDPKVLDPTIGRIKLLNQGNTLYLGLDTDDQAINGQGVENGRDGIRFTIRSLDSLTTTGTLGKIQFDFSVDSTGAIRYGNYAAELQEDAPGAVTAAVFIKGAGTAADPSDVDEGYQIEMAIDLQQALGYPSGLGERQLWLGVNYFDGDALDVPDNSYAMRTWLLAERADNAGLYGYLAPADMVANEGDAVPGELRLLGNYPNPFDARTQIQYVLPQAGEVSVAVYDLLGRRVAVVEPGLQAEGANAATVDAADLASGVYFYRVQLEGAPVSVTGRMVVVK